MALPPPDQKLYNPHAPYADPKSLRGAINYQGAPGKVMTKVSNLPGFRHLEQGLNKAGIKTSATATTPVPEGYTSTTAQAGKGVKALRAVKDVGLGMLAGAGIQAAASGFQTSTDDYSRRMGWRPTGVKAGSDGSLAAALTDPEFYRGLGHRAVGVATDVGRHTINAIPNTVGLVTDTVGLTKNLRDYDYGKNNFADLQAAPTPAPAKPSLRPQPAPVTTQTPASTAPAPAPAPAPDAPKPFDAPAGTTVTQPFADQPSLRKLVDAAGRTTYTNADKFQPLANGNVSTVGIDKAAIERGVAADRDLHNARIEAMDGRAPVEGGRVAVMGGEQPTGGADNTSPALRDLLNSPRAKYRMAAAQLLAGQDNNVADRASQDARAAAGLQAQAQRDEANNRAQALRDANNNAFTAGRDDLRFNRDVQLKGMEVGAAREKALRDWQDKQYDRGRAYRADQRTEEAHHAAQQKAVADALADMLGEDKRDDKGFVTGRLPNPQAAQALLGEYANAPADLKGFRDDKGNLVPIQHLDKNLQNKLVNAYLLRQQLAGARGKMGVDDVDALPSMWEMVTTPGAVSVAEDGSVKIGAGKINSAVSGGSTNLPWAGISESQLREIQKRVRALNRG